MRFGCWWLVESFGVEELGEEGWNCVGKGCEESRGVVGVVVFILCS